MSADVICWVGAAVIAHESGAQTSSSSLQKLRHERLFENVQGLIEVSARVVRCHARAEADPVLGNGRIINWRHPEAALPQLMSEAVHPPTIADDQRHDVGVRISGVDPEAVRLRAKILGIFPE